MTDRDEIERLLNQTGRTLEGLPSSYSMQEVESRFKGIVGGWTIGDCLLHQSDVIELLIGALRDVLEKQPKWIGVEDKLPVKECEVLVYIGACNITKGWYLGNGVFEVGIGAKYNANSPFDRIVMTHWMPLPEPPKEDA